MEDARTFEGCEDTCSQCNESGEKRLMEWFTASFIATNIGNIMKIAYKFLSQKNQSFQPYVCSCCMSSTELSVCPLVIGLQ